MPAFIPSIPVHFHKLLQDCRLASNTLDREFGRIVEMTIYHEFGDVHWFEVSLTDFPAMFVVRVIRPKEGITLRASKVLYVVFLA